MTRLVLVCVESACAFRFPLEMDHPWAHPLLALPSLLALAAVAGFFTLEFVLRLLPH